MVTHGEIKEFTHKFLFATWGDLLIFVWRETTMAGVEAAGRCFEEHAYRHPEGVLAMTIVEEGAPLPERPIRMEIARLLERAGGRAKRSAVVFEGGGFRAAAVRSVVTGLILVSKMPYPHKVFGTVDDAARFLEPKNEIAARMMSRAITAVRDRYEANLRNGR